MIAKGNVFQISFHREAKATGYLGGMNLTFMCVAMALTKLERPGSFRCSKNTKTKPESTKMRLL